MTRSFRLDEGEPNKNCKKKKKNQLDLYTDVDTLQDLKMIHGLGHACWTFPCVLQQLLYILTI